MTYAETYAATKDMKFEHIVIDAENDILLWKRTVDEKTSSKCETT